MADASALGADGSNPMEVQVLSPAPPIVAFSRLAYARRMKRAIGSRRAVIAWVGAVVLILVSLLTYQSFRQGYNIPVWQVDHFDHADFRYVAEIFWGEPHDLRTYQPDFSEDWGRYLDAVPFRGIGVGTYYLTLRALIGFVNPGVAADPIRLGVFIAWSMKLLLASAYAIFFGVCRRRVGTRLALLCLALLLFPWKTWILIEEMLVEPLVRILFVLAMSVLLSIHESRGRLRLGAALFLFPFLLAAHLKAPWMFYPLLILPAIVLRLHAEKLSLRHALPAVALTLCVPLTLLLVNVLWWQDLTLSPGAGLHAQFKTGEYTSSLCRSPTPLVTVFCNRTTKLNSWWNVYMGPDALPENYRALDRGVLPYILHTPQRMITDAFDGLRVASNVPEGAMDILPYGASLVILLLDISTWILLLVGLFQKETILLSAAGLGLWIIPAIGAIFALYDPRYHRPMAGIPLILAILIAVKLYGIWKKNGKQQKKSL